MKKVVIKEAVNGYTIETTKLMGDSIIKRDLNVALNYEQLSKLLSEFLEESEIGFSITTDPEPITTGD